MKTKLLSLIILLFSVQAAIAQRTITGTVSDDDGKELLVGASVVVTGTTKGTLTDVNGAFSLEVPKEATTLTFSYTGYANKVVSITGVNSLKVLLDGGSALQELVVTALGVVEKKAKLSYATQKLDAKEFNVSRSGDIAKQLSGQVPGLSITSGNGSGVSSSRIVLRGESSLNINKNQPLIIVDGVVVSNNLDGIGGNADAGNNMPVDYGNGLTDFNTDDIADISVLKGPKAAALYGSRAANGALVIRTKSGSEKQGIGVEFTTGVSMDKLGNFWDEQTQYGGGFDNRFRTDWGGNYGAPTDGTLISQTIQRELAAGITPAPTPNLKSLDRRGFFNTGVGFNNNLALNFAKDNLWGRVSVANLDKTGILPNTGYKRRNVSLRLGAKLTDKLQIDVSSNYVNSSSDNLPVIGGGAEGVIQNMFWGMNNYDYNAYKNYWVPGQEGITQNYFLSWGTNPYLIVNENLNGFNRDRLYGNVKATYQLADNLSFFVRAGTDFYTDVRTSRRPSGQPNFARGMYRKQDVGFKENNIDMLLTYTPKISDNIGLTISAGANRLDQRSSNAVVETRVLGIPGVYNIGNAGDVPRLTQYDAQKRINSVYGTAQFDYQSKLYLDVTGRNDWSSTLPLDNNSFFYPSIGASAIISEMVKLPEVISFAQLRASWAQTGSDTDPLLTQRVLAFGTLPSSVVNPALIINPALKPERTNALEFGGEVNFFKNRLGLEVNYYNRITSDQILQTPISQASGATSKLINAGKVKNSGVEMYLKISPIATKDFGWNLRFNWARNRGEVVELAEGIKNFVIAQGPAGGTVEARPGGRVGDMYGTGFARSPTGEIIYTVSTVADPRPGSTGTKTVVTPTIDPTIKLLGNYNPNWTAGMTNGFRFKNIELNMLFDYRSGGLLYTNTGALLYRSGIITETLPGREVGKELVPVGVVKKADGTFTPNVATVTGQDFYRGYFPQNNIEANSYDATFFKIREVSVGVDLKKWISNPKLGSLRLSIYGRNLLIKTKDPFLRHFDPESIALYGGTMLPGFEVGQLPNPRTFGVNLNVGF